MVSSTPVAVPSRSCARTAIRRASAIPTSRMRDALEPDRAREPAGRALQLVEDVAARPGLGCEGADAEHALGAVGLHVGAAEEAVARQQGQHVVAVDAFGLALVHLDHVPEPEQALE